MINYNAALPAMALSGRRGIDVNQWINDVKGNLTALARSMFASGEQGFFYDPNDLNTMFQNASGTVPVTDVGQPVGLMLDKSKQLERGVNLTNDLDFRTWDKVGGPTTDKTSFTVTTLGGVKSNVGMVVGKMYKIDIEYTTTNPTKAVDLFNGGYGGSPFLASTISGKISCYCIAAEAFLYFRSNNATVTVNKFVVQEVLGNHAYQTTSASRPILRKNVVTGANYLEFDGSDDFLQTANIDFTGTDKVSLFAGVRKLSDAASAIVAELSVAAEQNNGAFSLLAPGANGLNKFATVNRGTKSAFAVATDLMYSAPYSAVLTAHNYIPLKTTLSVNRSAIKDGGGAGTGNYGNYPLYIGRRAGTAFPFNGHIYGLIGVGKLVSDNETLVIEKEFAKRLGVTLNV